MPPAELLMLSIKNPVAQLCLVIHIKGTLVNSGDLNQLTQNMESDYSRVYTICMKSYTIIDC